MAHIDSGDSRGRSKNIELNLVPFIDYFTVREVIIPEMLKDTIDQLKVFNFVNR